MSVTSPGERKRELRAAVAARRDALPSAAVFSCGKSVQARALELPEYLDAETVVLYSAFQGEVPTEKILDHALSAGKTVYFPKLNELKAVAVAPIGSAADLKSSRYGAREPTAAAAPLPEKRQHFIVFVPGLAFDVHGNRLGRGLSWYDRLIKWLGRAGTYVGLAYELQLVDTVPSDEWDEKVDFLITEERTVDCRAPALPSRPIS
jgi:5-formyltetrahydrofolate cyclo-ligase